MQDSNKLFVIPIAVSLLLLSQVGSLQSALAFPSDAKPVIRNHNQKPIGKLEISADVQQPLGVPVILSVTITNEGNAPIEFWCSIAADYPLAASEEVAIYPRGEEFKVNVKNKHKPKEIVSAAAFNGAETGTKGSNRSIAPHQSLRLPLSIGVLPAGTYEVALTHPAITEKHFAISPQMTSNKVAVVVKADATKRSKVEADLFRRVQKLEPFATQVVSHYKLMNVIEKLPPLLLSDSEKEVGRVAQALVLMRKLPASCGKFVDDAVGKILKQSSDSSERSVLVGTLLPRLAAHANDRSALHAVMRLVNDGPSLNSRCRAVEALQFFRLPAAIEELRKLLSSKEIEIRTTAALALAERYEDRSAIPVLIEVSRTQQKPRRRIFYALQSFSSDARCKQAIEDGMKSPDKMTRLAAEYALRLHNVDGPRQEMDW